MTHKFLSLTGLLLFVNLVCLAQSNATTISLGGGTMSPNSNTTIGRGSAFNAGVYVPLTSFGNKAVRTAIGINAGAAYFSSNEDKNLDATYTSYKVTGQTLEPTVTVQKAGRRKFQGFSFEAGGQMNISIRNFIISPVVNAGYMNSKQKAGSVVQTSRTPAPGRDTTYNLYSQDETPVNGFLISPKLRITYFLGHFGLWAEGNYTSGPVVTKETSAFVPQGNPDQSGYYTANQMQAGTTKITITKNRYSTAGFNMGLSYSFGGKRHSPATSVATGSTGVDGGCPPGYILKDGICQLPNKTPTATRQWVSCENGKQVLYTQVPGHLPQAEIGTKPCTGDWIHLCTAPCTASFIASPADTPVIVKYDAATYFNTRISGLKEIAELYTGQVPDGSKMIQYHIQKQGDRVALVQGYVTGDHQFIIISPLIVTKEYLELAGTGKMISAENKVLQVKEVKPQKSGEHIYIGPATLIQ